MVTNHLVDDEAKEFFAELGIEIGLCGKLAEPRDLLLFAGRVGGRQAVERLVKPNRLGDAKPFREHVDQRRINVVDAAAIARQLLVRW